MMKFLIFVFSFFLVLACKEKEPTPNRPPGEFTVKSTLGTDGKTVTLNWTKAKDPDGDAVTYTVVLGSDTLAKGLTDTVYVLKNLNYDFKGSGSVLALDSKKLSSSSSISIITNENPFVEIPDANFEKELIKLKIDKDGVVNKRMAKIDTKGVLRIHTAIGAGISNVTGIEAFEDLISLDLRANKLTSLDVSKNTNLKYLDCESNKLQSIDVSYNTNLEFFNCFGNDLKNLDVSKNIKLTELNCGYNILKSLDVSKNVNLKNLEIYNYLPSSGKNQITSLDLSKNTNLKFLNCTGNLISVLGLSNNENLTYLDCSANEIKILDLSKNIKIENLYCAGNKLTNLDVMQFANLRKLHCGSNKITSLDVTKNKKLEYLVFYDNLIKSIDINNCTNLEELSCQYNFISSINISKNSILKRFNCENNQIKTICVSDVAKAKANKDWKKDPTAEYKICN